MTGVLAVEFRRSPGIWLAPALAVLAVVLTQRDAAYWAGDWHATSIEVQFPVLVLGPVLAGFAAWTAGRERRHGHEPIAATAPRTPVSRAAVQWVALTCWGLLAYVVEAGVAVARTASRAGGGGPWPSYLLLGIVALITYPAVGFAIGRILPGRLTPALVAVGAFGLLVAGATDRVGLNRLALYHGDILVSPALRIRPAVWLLQLGWSAAVLLLAVAAVRCWHTRARGPLAMAAVALLVAGAVGVTTSMLVGSRDLTARAAPAAPACQGSEPRVCMWPDHAKWAGPAAVVAGRLHTALSGIYRFPATVYEAGLHTGRRAGTPELTVGTVPVTEVSLVAGLTDGLLPEKPPSCLLADPARFDRYVLMQAWLDVKGAGRVSPGISVDGARLAEIMSWGDDQQRAWFRDGLSGMPACARPGASP